MILKKAQEGTGPAYIFNMKLNQVKSGELIELLDIPSGLKAELIRLGLSKGDKLKCIAKIPSGPVVLQKDLQEIAIGDKFAREITIKN